jgi:DNA invertase Pin-like site-specific DNA recombinase
MGKTKRAAIYARVSTNGQTTAQQVTELRAAAERHGWQIVGEYVDHGISGAKGRDQRPKLDAMLKAATRREFDVIMAWSVDRLGRSLQHLVALLGEIHATRVDLFLLQQGLDTSTPSGRMLFQVLGTFAEFERALIKERVMAGLKRAKAEGKRLGRPQVGVDVERRVRALKRKGMGIISIARAAKCGVSTVQRIVAQRNAT